MWLATCGSRGFGGLWGAAFAIAPIFRAKTGSLVCKLLSFFCVREIALPPLCVDVKLCAVDIARFGPNLVYQTGTRVLTLNAIDNLLDAAQAHVVFDGWSEATFDAAVRDCGLSTDRAALACPRGSVDLAVAYHRRGDAAIAASDGLDKLRYSEKVAELVWRRVQASEKDIVRRSMALFSLPQNGAEGAALIWATADAIWTALGDTSDDINWYSKRAILSGVVGSTMLFWLGDVSERDQDTRAFIDRRIANVMQFEKFKARMRDNAAFKPLISLQDSLLAGIRAPRKGPFPAYPGWQRDDAP